MRKILTGITYTILLSIGNVAFAETAVNNDNAINDSENIESKGIVKYLPKSSVLSFKVNVLNKHVYNESNKKIGDIRDVLFDNSGYITHYIVGAGGFMGVAEHDVAISMNEFEQENDHYILRNYTKEKLKALKQIELSKPLLD